MNAREQLIYNRGLERIYGCILLGENEQAMSCMEELIYLTRGLSASARQSLGVQMTFLSRACRVCWQGPPLEVLLEKGTDMICTAPWKISWQIFEAIAALEDAGKPPSLLRLQMDGGALYYELSDQGHVYDRGVLPDA